MNQLANAIQSAGLSGTAAEIVTAFDGAGTPITDSTSYSLSGLANALAAKGVDLLVLVGLRGHVRDLPIGGDTLEGFLIAGGGTSGGVDCSRADIRYQIGLNQSHPSTSEAQQAILAGMLLVGSTPRKLWEQHQLGSLPTEDAVSEALIQIETAEWWSHVRDDLIPARLAAGDTVAELKAVVAGA